MKKQQWIKAIEKRLKHYVSPLFLALVVAAFILWYLAKLTYTYTTEQQVRVNLDGQRFSVTCVVEGRGTDLFRERMNKKTLHIPLREVKYHTTREEDGTEKIQLDSASLQHAISARFSDLSIHSVSDIPEVARPAKQ